MHSDITGNTSGVFKYLREKINPVYMKIHQILFFTGCLTLFFSCQAPEKKMGDFQLLPLPRHVEFSGTSSLTVEEIRFCHGMDGCELPVRGELLNDLQPVKDPSLAHVLFQVGAFSGLKPEGYSLSVSKKQISIKAIDRAGLMYGFMTLEQLLEDASEQDVPLPVCSIEDYPLLSYRAIHLDMKHHREKTEYYYRLMDKLASYKVNAIIAEVEDKLRYVRQPLVASEDALSIEEWKKLCDYALERNIEISPLVQGLGHASFILKHEEYKDLRDDPASDWAFNPLDPETYKVQYDLYLDALEAMPHGRYLHVGGDEVHTTGRGSGMTELELQLTWLNKVCQFAEENGRIPIFWDDMPIKYAGLYSPMFDTRFTRAQVDSMWAVNDHKLLENLDLFPKNCIYMRWNYSSPQAEGNIKAMEWFSENGLQVMGATAGQTRWVLMPRNESNLDNIRSFALSSIEKGIDGLLLTLWDDDSPHFELYMRGILAFAEYSWSGDRRSKDEIKAAYRHREYANLLSGDAYAFVDQLEKMAGWWNTALLKGQERNALRYLADPLQDGVMELPDAANPGAWTETHALQLEAATTVIQECDAVAATISSMKEIAIRNHYRLEVYEQVNELVRFSARVLLTLQTYDSAQDKQKKGMAFGQIQLLRDEFIALRTQLEKVYGETRILNKPAGYLLDQDHHHHLANQTLSFDWQFTAELFFLDKIDRDILNR